MGIWAAPTARAEEPTRAESKVSAPASKRSQRAPKAADAATTKRPASKADASKRKASRPKGPDVVDVTQENEQGEKKYEFEAVEVEGRLKAPQIIYFLRRVRAEFEARRLGHRSFLPELKDTRRDRAFR